MNYVLKKLKWSNLEKHKQVVFSSFAKELAKFYCIIFQGEKIWIKIDKTSFCWVWQWWNPLCISILRDLNFWGFFALWKMQKCENRVLNFLWYPQIIYRVCIEMLFFCILIYLTFKTAIRDRIVVTFSWQWQLGSMTILWFTSKLPPERSRGIYPSFCRIFR